VANWNNLNNTHPDFLWLPTQVLSGGGVANPYVSLQAIRQMLVNSQAGPDLGASPVGPGNSLTHQFLLTQIQKGFKQNRTFRVDQSYGSGLHPQWESWIKESYFKAHISSRRYNWTVPQVKLVGQNQLWVTLQFSGSKQTQQAISFFQSLGFGLQSNRPWQGGTPTIGLPPASVPPAQGSLSKRFVLTNIQVGFGQPNRTFIPIQSTASRLHAQWETWIKQEYFAKRFRAANRNWTVQRVYLSQTNTLEVDVLFNDQAQKSAGGGLFKSWGFGVSDLPRVSIPTPVNPSTPTIGLPGGSSGSGSPTIGLPGGSTGGVMGNIGMGSYLGGGTAVQKFTLRNIPKGFKQARDFQVVRNYTSGLHPQWESWIKTSFFGAHLKAKNHPWVIQRVQLIEKNTLDVYVKFPNTAESFKGKGFFIGLGFLVTANLASSTNPPPVIGLNASGGPLPRSQFLMGTFTTTKDYLNQMKAIEKARAQRGSSRTFPVGQ
jgi:hypothetical protein